MNSKFTILALGAVIAFSMFMSVYALHARSSAIRGWAEATRLAKNHEADVAVAKKMKMNHETNIAQVKADAAGAFELQRILVLKSAGLPITAPLNPHQANLAIRDYVYRSNRLGNASHTFQSNGHRYALLGEAGFEQLCGGMAMAFQWALTKIGLPARTVQLAGEDFLAGKNQYDTHVSVEVWLDGKWQISDPTFNISVRCSSGKGNLSVPEARDCIKNGGKLVAIPGRTQISSRTIADYYAPYDNFFAAYRRARIDTPAVEAEMDEYPEPEWVQRSISLYSK